MNKTISANISGIIFNIEEVAYERLKVYLEAIRAHFANSADCDEIMADIEGRIAELFQERISDSKEVISMADVEEVTATMGRPEDYGDQDLDDDDEYSSDNNSGTIPNQNPRKNRRIFRDPDNSRVGGVCSGLSAYLGWDPIWLRIAFLVMLLWLGTGVLLYIILWIVIPEAKTTADKLEMHGEPVNVENIGKSFGKAGSETIDDIANGARKLDTEANAQKIKSAALIIAGYIGGFFKVFGKFFGGALIIVSIGLLIALCAVLLGADGFISITDNGIATLSYSDVSALLFGSQTISTAAWFGILLVIGVPILSFMYTGIKLLFNLKTNLKPVGIALTSLWIIGLILCGYVALTTGTDFASDSDIEEEFVFEQPSGDTLYLDILDDPYFSNNYEDHHHNYPDLVNIDDEKIHFGWPLIDVRENKRDTTFAIVVNRQSQGPNQNASIDLAENIEYNIQQNGDQINFSTFFSVDKEDLFRGQHVDITIYVPQGKSVYFSPRMDRVIYDVKNVTNTRDEYMVDLVWTMTRKGLACVNCKLSGHSYYGQSDYDDDFDDDEEQNELEAVEDTVTIEIEENP